MVQELPNFSAASASLRQSGLGMGVGRCAMPLLSHFPFDVALDHLAT